MESLTITRSKFTWNYTVIGIVILIITGGFFFLTVGKGIGKGDFFKNRFRPNNNSNITTLNKLNEEWELPDGYTMETVQINSMDANWIYSDHGSQEKVILQLHGGAYIHSLEDNGIQYQRSAVKYAEISDARVLTIDYRVAPEDPFPAALEDAVMAYKWLLSNDYKAENIIIAGDSAGGGLTLATTMYLRDNKIELPAALITMSAWTDLSYTKLKVPYVGESSAKDPYISPLYGNYEKFPPMLMQVGGAEELLKDTTKVAKKAKAADVKVTQTTYDDMFHVFQLLYPVLPEASVAWDEVERFIQTIPW